MALAINDRGRSRDDGGVLPSCTLVSRSSHNVRSRRRRWFPSAVKPLSVAQLLLFSLIAFAALCEVSHARSIDLGRQWARYIDGEGQLADRSAEPRGDRQPNDAVFVRQDPASQQQSPTPTASASTSSTLTPTPASSGSSATTSSITNLPLPKVFDSSLGNNFTSTACPQFFNSFLSDESFTNCLPLSLLLQTSQSFFEDESNPEALTEVLDASCNVVFPTCNALMATLASQLKAPGNCGTEFSLGNPLVTGAYNGFLAYAPLYQAGCLKASASAGSTSTTSDTYCFVAATKKGAQPADSYLYSLPLGIALPGSSRPTCSPCLQQTMKIYAASAQNLSSPLSADYSDAATQVNSGCGPNFVNSTVQPIQGTQPKSAASVLLPLGSGSVLAAAIGVAMWLL